MNCVTLTISGTVAAPRKIRLSYPEPGTKLCPVTSRKLPKRAGDMCVLDRADFLRAQEDLEAHLTLFPALYDPLDPILAVLWTSCVPLLSIVGLLCGK